MKQPDINRLRRAAEHLRALRPHLDKAVCAITEDTPRLIVERVLDRADEGEYALCALADYYETGDTERLLELIGGN